jgi:hypothetical protein
MLIASKIHRNVPFVVTFKIVQIIPFHAELWLPWQAKEKTLNTFFSKTQRARAKIFGMNIF